LAGRFLNGFEHLSDNFRMQDRCAVGTTTFRPPLAYILWLPLERSQTNPALSSIASASVARRRGVLGTNLDGSGKYLPAQRGRALLLSERFQKKFNGLSNISKGFVDRRSLRLAPLQIRAPGVKAMLVAFYDDT
jgi:hypothetical protein